MTQATALTTIWPRVVLFNYFAVPMPFEDTATARRLMSRFNTSHLSPLELGRLQVQLDKLYSFTDGVFTLRHAIERLPSVEKQVRDGMMNYSRRYFNSLGSNEAQDKYVANLQAKRLYFVNGIQVPKCVYDAVEA
jgi:hypothetical protein